MRDKSIINVPIYRTKPVEIENNLFPPTKSEMITGVINKVDNFKCSQTNNIIVENSGKNYKLEVVKITAKNVAYNKSNMVLLQMTVVPTRDRYSIFIKTVYKSIKWRTVLKYCSVVFGLSLLAAITWDAIKAILCLIVGFCK